VVGQAGMGVGRTQVVLILDLLDQFKL
jgi:hypothetical protein